MITLNIFLDMIKKFWYILVIVVILLAAALFFYFKDPFGIIKNSNNAKLKETSLIIREIKSIGEFSAAKYYGESLKSLKLISIANSRSDLERTYRQVTEIYESIKESESKYVTKTTSFDGKISISLMFRIMNDWKYMDMIRTSRYKMMKTIFGYISDINLLEEISKMSFEEKYKQNPELFGTRLKKYTEWKMKYIDLVCIGRGYVKAGYDFTDGTDDRINISVDLTNDVVKITNLKPIVFTPVINPWFEPGKTQGFEVVFSKWNGSIKDENFNLVISECERALLADAKKRNVEKAAKENTEVFLTQYISYIVKRPKLKVIIE